MIYVSQGHENGIGLEIFLKSIICLDSNFVKKIHLFSSKISLINTLKTINIPFQLHADFLTICNKELKCSFITSSKYSESMSSLLAILDIISADDVLITLPTSKGEIHYDGTQYNGYTDFLRSYFTKKLTMNFVGNNSNVMLLTDHIAIEEVPQFIKQENIESLISISLNHFPKNIKTVILSALNPHVGEGGLISKDDSHLFTVVSRLAIKYPEITFLGPLPSDTLQMHTSKSPDELVIYCYHDQGLNPFKLSNGLIGINLTLGLEFTRVSVDHGTAFDLYGKNCANYQGMLFLLQEIKKWTKKSPTKSRAISATN